ncbi:MAG TPA: hypothetical protein VL307_06770 [Chitinophagaceae bacterium]|nr:hypothetical protein [Chitinophagaceae bacterium]
MRILILATCILIVATFQADFYSIEYETITGVPSSTQSLKGKKTIICVMKGGKVSLSMVHHLDSLQRQAADTRVLLVPAADASEQTTKQEMVKLQKKLQLTITAPLRVKQQNAAAQHPLFSWLTNAQANRHFDTDADEDGKIFVISATGNLYSVLPGNTPLSVINSAINTPFSE